MSILSTNKRLIKVGQDYSAGSGISIDDGVISVTGEFGKTYSAGENIDIYEQDEQLYISSKDWEQDIANASANAYNEAVAQIPDPFDPSYLSAQIDNKLNSSDFTTWQNGQYNTDLQTIEGQINNKLDTSSFSDVSGSFLTAINIPESATWNEVSQAYEQASGTYLTSHQSLEGYATQDWVQDQGYLTGVSIPESAVWQDVSTTVQSNSAQWADGGTGDPEVNSFVYDNSATILDVDTTYQQNSATYLTSHQDISYKLDTTAFSTVSGEFLTAAPADMATTGDVAELAQTVSETYQVKGDYLTTADSANFYPANNPSSFATENWVTEQGYITGVDLSEYAKRDFVLSSIESATSGKLDVSSFASISGDFLTSEDLNGYATEQWVGEQGYLTEVSIPESANWNEATTTVQTNSSNWDNVTNKLDTTSFSDVSSTFLTAVDLTPYQTIEGMTAYQPAGSYATTNELEQVSADITATIPSTAGLASESYVQTNSAVLTGMIDGKQDTLTFGYDEQDRISSINSSALAGGGDVPEDVMVETNLEYNAVNEISGYNGSAIAQYGAEKQWLVHDDTIVSISNSAQYAFGCNISALQRLMGIDETVLFSSTTSAGVLTANLSEPLSSFNTIEVYSNRKNAGDLNLIGYTKFKTDYTPSFISITGNTIAGTTQTFLIYEMFGVSQTALSYISGTNILVNGTNMSVLESPGFSNAGITKVVGIGRKQ